MLKRIWGDRWGLRRFLICWLLLFAGLVVYAKLGFLEPTSSFPRERFDRQACLRRHNPGLDAPSEDDIGRIARACAVEESEYYRW